jgi:hypothetical protein
MLSAGAGAAWSAEVTLVPSSETIVYGETVTVAVEVTDAAGLLGYQLDVRYQDRFGKLVNVREGEFLKSDGAGAMFVPTQTSSNDDRRKKKKKKPAVTLAGVRIGKVPGISGSGTLALLTFEGTEKAGDGKPVKKLSTKISRKSVILVEE